MLNGRPVKTFALLWIAAVLAGCGPRYTGEPRGEYENENNGLDGQLTFDTGNGVTVNAGQTVSLKVSRSAEGASLCQHRLLPRNDSMTGLPAGSTSFEECAVAPSSPVRSIVRATCSTADCTLVIRGDRIDVRAATESKPEVEVTVELANGRQISDHIRLDVVEVTELRVECSTTFPCPSNHGLFAQSQMFVRPFAKSKWNIVPVTLTAEPADLVSFSKQDPRDDWWAIGLLKPGKVRLTAVAGTHTWTRDIEIASPQDVVSGALHVRGADLMQQGKFGSDYVVIDANVAGPLATSTQDAMVLLWTLKNGTTVLDTDAKTTSNTKGWYTSNSWSHVSVYALSDACAPGPVQLSASMGGVQATFALEGTCPH